MYKKIYMFLNKRTEQLTGEPFTCFNDREAQYKFSVEMDRAKESNKYFMENDFQLVCLGQLFYNKSEMHIETKDYPYAFDEIKDGWRPPAEQNVTEDINQNFDNYSDARKQYEKEIKEMKGVK